MHEAHGLTVEKGQRGENREGEQVRVERLVCSAVLPRAVTQAEDVENVRRDVEYRPCVTTHGEVRYCACGVKREYVGEKGKRHRRVHAARDGVTKCDALDGCDAKRGKGLDDRKCGQRYEAESTGIREVIKREEYSWDEKVRECGEAQWRRFEAQKG